jgi:hypothetical protein
MVEHRVNRETVLKAKVQKDIPFAKYDWFTKHYKVPVGVKREVYQAFRRLSQKTGLVSIDELAVELNYPIKAVISAVQEIADTELAPVAIVFTPLTEFVVGRELLSEVPKLVKETVGSSRFVVVENPLRVMRAYGIDTDKAPEFNPFEELVDESEVEKIDL